MGKPTLLVAGKLVGHPGVTPVDYIIKTLKRGMPEFGGAPPAALADRVYIVRSETGSGKSTVLPASVFRLLRAETSGAVVRLAGPGVICTQPRVLTAQTIARDLAADADNYPDLLMGVTIGYQTGPVNEKPANGLIYATVGNLLAQMRVMDDADIIAQYRFIIVDEAHERSLDIDSLLMRLKALLKRNLGNPKLPFLLLASATLPVEKYARFFEVPAANVFEVTGRQYDVETFYPKVGTNMYTEEAARVALRIHEAHADDPPGRADILVFMPGRPEVLAVQTLLLSENDRFLKAGASAPPYLVLAITRDEILAQDRDFRLLKEDPNNLPPIPMLDGSYMRPARRIIIATVVAETGLTLDALKYVIDCGWSRESESYYPGRFKGLITRPAPRSRVDQRKGRSGRLFPGEFYPLYTKSVYEALQVEQSPEIITEGVSPIILDIAASAAKPQPSGQRVFRVEDIDMLDPPPVDALAASLEEAITFGYLRSAEPNPDGKIPGHVVTRLGEVAGRFNYLEMPQTQTLIAGYLWNVSIRDLALIVALYGERDAILYSQAPPGPSKASEDEQFRHQALQAGLPDFLRTVTGGGEDEPPGRHEMPYYRARLLISDDFIEALVAFSGFARAADRAHGDLDGLLTWCDENGVDFGRATLLSSMRDQVIDEALQAGLNPFWGEEYHLADASAETFFDIVVRLKNCIYAGLQFSRLTYSAGADAYRAVTGDRVEVPPAYSAAELSKLRGLGADTEAIQPKSIVTNMVRIAGARQDRSEKYPPLLYRLQSSLVSVLDGYVAPDPEAAEPRRRARE